MSVHALFRMARSLYPVAPQTGTRSFAPAAPAPVPSPPMAPQAFKPSHALYSTIANRHASLQKSRAAFRPPVPAAKMPDTAPKTPDSVPQEAT